MSSKETSGAQARPVKRESFIPYFIFVLIALYALHLLISTRTEIREKESELEAIQVRLSEVHAANEQLERFLRADEYLAEYMESIARGRLSFAHPRERIYYIMPSS
jgi:cell division protein FtsB